MGVNKKEDILEKEFDFSKAIKNPYVINKNSNDGKSNDKDLGDTRGGYDIDKLNPRKIPYAEKSGIRK